MLGRRCYAFYLERNGPEFGQRAQPWGVTACPTGTGVGVGGWAGRASPRGNLVGGGHDSSCTGDSSVQVRDTPPCCVTWSPSLPPCDTADKDTTVHATQHSAAEASWRRSSFTGRNNFWNFRLGSFTQQCLAGSEAPRLSAVFPPPHTRVLEMRRRGSREHRPRTPTPGLEKGGLGTGPLPRTACPGPLPREKEAGRTLRAHPPQAPTRAPAPSVPQEALTTPTFKGTQF